MTNTDNKKAPITLDSAGALVVITVSNERE